MEIPTSIVGSTAENISNCLFDAAGRRIGFLLNYNDNIEALRKKAQKLEATRGSIQVKIDAAERNREIILPDVKNWISEVDNVSVEAATFLEGENNANTRCSEGRCINLRSRYRFSKAAKQKIAVITQLQEDGNFQTLSQPAPPPLGFISPSLGFSGIFESRESIKKEIMEALKNDKVSKIGIYGMGGVGKTTLVKQIGKQAKEEKMYDSFVMVVVSQTPIIMNIQSEIAEMLGLTSLSVDSKSARANSLCERIKKEKRILIVLDDIWANIKLEEIGIPFGKDHGGCKIVLTSRSRNVCDQMGCDKTFIVETLSKQESWALFKGLVGMDVENSTISPIARELAAECDGLQIAIVTIVGALKNKKEHVWIDMARQLKMSTPTDIPRLQGRVISSLELSFKYLESEDARSLFLFCSLFSEDFNISIEVLVRYGVALRWFKNVETMEDVRHKAHATVSTLTTSFLLIYEKKDGGEEYVKMHDVVRDVAHIMAPKHNQIFLVKASIGLEEWPNTDTFEDLTCISMISNDIKEVPDGMECPKLQSLLLQGNFKLFLPNNFFRGMKDLRVLDLSETQLLPLPESLSLLANLRILYLDGCKLGDLSIIGHLSKLEILSLSGSHVTEIPISFSQLVHLRLLDLNDCKELTRIAHGVISSLRKLEELYISRSFREWDLEGDEGDSRNDAKLAELQYLCRLTSLQIFIPNLNLLPDNDVPFKNLSSFTIEIGAPEYSNLLLPVFGSRRSLRISSSRISYSRKIKISNDEARISWLPECIKNLVIQKTEYLSVSGLGNIFHDLVNRGLNDLKGLAVEFQEVTYLLNPLERASNLNFQNLEELQIYGSPKLVEICHGEPPIQSFNKLKYLSVSKCNRLSNIVPSDLLQRFQNLEFLKVSHCESVVYIFDYKQLRFANRETKLSSSLKDLDLDFLPKMTNIWKGDTRYIDLYNLKTISLSACQNLIKVFSPALLQSLVCLEEMKIHVCMNLEEIFPMKEEEEEEKGIVTLRKDHTTTSPSLGNLTYIEILHCFRLKRLFTPTIVKRMVKLRTLVIRVCSMLVEIITKEDSSTEERIVFPSLSNLELDELEDIACFSSGSYSVEFPVLETVEIKDCPNMKTFGYGEQLTPKLNKDKVNIDNGESKWKGDLNSTVRQCYIKQSQEGKSSGSQEDREEEEEEEKEEEGEEGEEEEDILLKLIRLLLQEME